MQKLGDESEMEGRGGDDGFAGEEEIRGIRWGSRKMVRGSPEKESSRRRKRGDEKKERGEFAGDGDFGEGGGGDGGAAVWRRRRLEDGDVAMTMVKYPWLG